MTSMEPSQTRRYRTRHVRAVAAAVALLAALGLSAGASARNPSPAQKSAIVAALRSVQGDVAIQTVVVSKADPGYASLKWGFANGGLSSFNNSLLGLTNGGSWKVLWTREWEQPADGACVYVPAAVARDLLHVSCPPAPKLHARAATAVEAGLIHKGFLSGKLTPYAKNAKGLAPICVSKLDPTWASAVARFSSGATVFVWFRHGSAGGHWTPMFESLAQGGSPPPPWVVISLATCVGYNPADFDG